MAAIQSRQVGPITPLERRPARTGVFLGQHTSDTLLERLGITIETRAHCLGKNSKDTACGKWINKSNRERIMTIMIGIIIWGLSDVVLKMLEELSTPIMCVRWNQVQTPHRFQHWATLLKSDELLKRQQQATASSQTFARQSNQGARNMDKSRASARSSQTVPWRVQTSGFGMPQPSPSRERPFRSSTYVKTAIQQTVTSPRPTPVSSRTRSSTSRQHVSTHSLVSSQAFEPLPTVKSPAQVTQHVVAKIKEKISPAELPSGYVYGFRRTGCDLIKIGMTTKTVDERMRCIGYSCGYTPRVVFAVKTDYAMKIEHLVHRQLYRQNHRECLVDGRCYNGRGCSSKHKEWFEGVSDSYAEEVVRAWARWIRTKPYDLQGRLKDVWVLKVKHFDLSSLGYTWKSWLSVPLVQEAQMIEDEAWDPAIKTEKVPRWSFLSSLSTSVDSTGYVSPVSSPRTVSVCA